VPGILHTAEYATAVMAQVIAFYQISDDLTGGVTARMQRQRVVYKENHRLHFILAQQAFLTTVGTVVSRSRGVVVDRQSCP